MSSKNFYGLTGDVTVDGGILNVGNAQLYANTETSNVGVGTSNPEFQLDVHGDANVGVLYSTFLHGDGSNIQNIVSSQWEGSPGDPIYYASNVGIANTSPVTSTMQIGSNVVIDDVGSNVIHVTGNIYADYLVGDGSQLTGIAASLDQIVDQGNTVSNTIQIVSGQDATSNIGLVTHEGVSISVSNANPTGEFQFGVGSNLLVNVYSSNVLIVDGNVFAQKMTLGTVTVTPAYNLQQIMATGATSDQTLILSNATTGLTTASNVGIANTAPVHTLDVGSNLYVEDTGSNVLTVTGNVSVSNLQVTERLDVGSNLHIENLRVAEVAANLVTYDSATGELMDSAGLFSNKLAVVSEQPPVALTGASTVVEKHGTYTIEASSTATGSEVYHLFDKVSGETNKWVTDGNYSTVGETKGDYNGSANLTGEDNPTGEWVKITMPYKTILRHVKIESTNQSVEDIKLVGLNSDGLTWSVLKTVTGLTGTTHTIIVNATTHHKTYGLIVEKTNTTTGRSAVEIGDLKLFTESFSIDGGKVEMATSMVMGGETTMDQHGPHGRGEAKLKKYPEIAMKSPTQAGYVATATSIYSSYYDAWEAFNGIHTENPSYDGWEPAGGANYNTLGAWTGGTGGNTEVLVDSIGTIYGDWLQIQLPHKVIVSSFTFYPLHVNGGTYDDLGVHRSPKSGHLLGSTNGTTWYSVHNWSNFSTGWSDTTGREFVVTSSTAYDYYRLIWTQTVGGTYGTYASAGELELYGYEELATEGDTSVDTTFTSVMNTPQTTGAKVYVDGPTLENKITTGPDATGPSATYDSPGKYWELNGTLTSNIAVEANTFLEGDQPHSVSVWFNSSNLEANVSNTCVFSISDQEKLDSVNLDLQSNTWHNLTYAYQGEGGSRVTYLDGRKVAEDQAEDTFGEYPPFAMTGYSQGGYVVSASYDNTGISREAWRAFDDDTSSIFDTSGGAFSSGQPGLAASTGSFPGEEITLTDGTTHTRGQWLQLEFPFKFVVSSYYQRADTNDRQPQNVSLLGSNDNTSWYIIKDEHTLPTQSENTIAVNTTNGYKYLRYVIHAIVGSDDRAVINEFKFYGHRENDLVRLPDPTNVLKYPHIAMTGPAQRGYVASASSLYLAGGEAIFPAWEAFDYNTSVNNRWASENAQNYNGGSFLYSGNKNLGTNNGGSGTPNGEWLMIEMPHKIKLHSTKLIANGNALEVPDKFIIYGSNNLTGVWSVVDNTYETTSAAIPFGGTGKTWTVSTSASPVAYKYFGLVVRNTTGSTYITTVNEWELYGTGVDSIPIQIGGGNIDKVANFRVYGKFVGEDQALEIWDAQKDEFGRAKSSMTLQKGRLGIGTTEPEGRLAVLDEPHNLEEFPPRAMTGYETYMEGHGEFCVSASSTYSNYYPWQAFDRNITDNSSVQAVWHTTADFTNATPGIYNASASLGGYTGAWLKLKLPYSIKPSKVSIHPRTYPGGTSNFGQNPLDFLILGSKDDITWDVLSTQVGVVFGTTWKEFILSPANNNYKYFAISCTKTKSGTFFAICDMKYFGTREQGQSVLHDGQLTLTKSLNVPRIGPALDADDTPRRDRLVVEYNTSTNPTFEGAVRDTSGRGNDGFMYGNTYYDATTKDVTFDGLGADHIERKNIGFSGEQLVSVSIWFRYNSIPTSRSDIFAVGKSGTATQFGLATYTAGTYLYTGGNDIYNTGYNLITDTSWHHIVAIYRGGTPSTTTMSLYLDNVDVTGNLNFSTASQSVNFDPNDCDLVIGSTIDTVADVNGSVSNFKLYDTALTAEEVKTLYDMGRNGSMANPQPLHIAAPLYAPGTIVQVESSTKTDTFSTTGASSHPVSPGNDVPGLAVTIHPKFANSKILISYDVNMGSYGRAYLRIQRKQGGSITNIEAPVGPEENTQNQGKSTSSYSGGNDSHLYSASFTHYDTAGSTTPITYQIQAWTYHGTYYAYINRAHIDGNGSNNGTYWARTLSSITAKEVCQ